MNTQYDDLMEDEYRKNLDDYDPELERLAYEEVQERTRLDALDIMQELNLE
jgi:hypothetical protein